MAYRAMPGSAEQPARNSLATIERALKEAGASLSDVIRCGVFVTSTDHVQDVMGVLAEKFDRVRPTNTTTICQLPVPDAKVEIEVTARVQSTDRQDHNTA